MVPVDSFSFQAVPPLSPYPTLPLFPLPPVCVCVHPNLSVVVLPHLFLLSLPFLLRLQKRQKITPPLLLPLEVHTSGESDPGLGGGTVTAECGFTS